MCESSMITKKNIAQIQLIARILCVFLTKTDQGNILIYKKFIITDGRTCLIHKELHGRVTII